jgi:hypothetical protein
MPETPEKQPFDFEKSWQDYQFGFAKEQSLPQPGEKPIDWAYNTVLQQQNQEEFKKREGFTGGFRELLSSGAKATVGFSESLLRAGKTLNKVTFESPGLQKSLSNLISGIQTYQNETPLLQQNPNLGYIGQAITKGIESAIQSRLIGIPGAVAGAGIGAVVSVAGGPEAIPGGAILGFALGGGGIAGLAEYDQFMEQVQPLIKKGLVSKEDAHTAALWSGIAEFGFEAVSDYIEARLMKFPGLSIEKQAAKTVVKEIFGVGYKNLLKRLGKTELISVLGEVPSEMATAAIQSELRRGVGLPSERWYNAAGEAFGPSFVAAMIFGAVGQTSQELQRRSSYNTLIDGKAPILNRMNVADAVYNELKSVDPLMASQWRQSSYASIMAEQGINPDQQFTEDTATIDPIDIVNGKTLATYKTRWDNLENTISSLNARLEKEHNKTKRTELQGKIDQLTELQEIYQAAADQATTILFSDDYRKDPFLLPPPEDYVGRVIQGEGFTAKPITKRQGEPPSQFITKEIAEKRMAGVEVERKGGFSFQEAVQKVIEFHQQGKKAEIKKIEGKPEFQVNVIQNKEVVNENQNQVRMDGEKRIGEESGGTVSIGRSGGQETGPSGNVQTYEEKQKEEIDKLKKLEDYDSEEQFVDFQNKTDEDLQNRINDYEDLSSQGPLTQAEKFHQKMVRDELKTRQEQIQVPPESKPEKLSKSVEQKVDFSRPKQGESGKRVDFSLAAQTSVPKKDQSKEDITNTEPFKKWFKKSKVVDESNNPKVVYHGTQGAGFDKFNFIGKGNLYGPGYYFTESPEIASEYTENKKMQPVSTLKLIKPLDDRKFKSLVKKLKNYRKDVTNNVSGWR